jgi:hypothetical protein
MSRLFFVALTTLLTLSQLTAATFFVRTDGNDSCSGLADAGGSSGTCAFRTLERASSIAQAGDTVTVRSGSYAGWSSRRSGTADSRITFAAKTGEIVTITSQILIEHSYITVDGFTTTYSGSSDGGAAIRVGYSSTVGNVTVTNNKISGNGSNTILVYLKGTDFLFDRNLMEGKPTFFIGMVQYGRRHTVSNNTFRNVVNVERLFNVGVSDSVWRDNEIYNFSWTGDSRVHPDIWQTINDGAIAQNNIIEKNYVHDSPSCQLGNTETNSSGTNVSNWTWRNNVFANMGTLYVWTGNFKFYNNTFYRSGSSSQVAVYLYQGTYGNGSGADFKNNIFLQDSNQGAVAVASGNVTWTHNYNFFANTNFTSRSGWSEANGVNGGNPQFAAAFTNCITNVCNFRIGASSAALDKGTLLSAVTTDKEGTARPYGAAIDIGAYEYSPDQSSVSVLPPSNLTAIIR